MLSSQYNVIRMTNVDWNNPIVKATFDLDTPLGIHCDMLLKQGETGFWIEAKSHKLLEAYTDKNGKLQEYKSDFFIHKDARNELIKLVSTTYDPASAPGTTYAKTANGTSQTAVETTVEELPLSVQ